MPIHGDSFSMPHPSVPLRKETANVCLDEQGNELPIRYKASDLVNRSAPAGYHWEIKSEVNDTLQRQGHARYSDPRSQYDYYIAVKDKDAAPAPPERKYYDGQLVTAPGLNGHPYSIVEAEFWKGEWMYRLSNCLGSSRESELSLELRSK